jgi:hypothetical protein
MLMLLLTPIWVTHRQGLDRPEATHNLALLCLIRFLEINLIRDAGTIKNLDHGTCPFLT